MGKHTDRPDGYVDHAANVKKRLAAERRRILRNAKKSAPTKPEEAR